ncbi:MAG: hypothetical protein A3G20_07750 [Acidobacteria bacterium RIFCSPLOWO2_12_FULL_59_11]|nr:MAG: hypothetical protein A3G20_07750 [Acidobacteria bacterium RIFCSPLOWO2_12_FULL_59_11]
MSSSSTPSTPAPQPFFRRWLSPWAVAGLLVGIFLLIQGYLFWHDRALMAALDNFPPFAAPAFELQVSKKTPYDPLSYIGRGARAGLWQWSPEGLILTEKGRKFFRESGEMFISQAAAGKRKVTRVRNQQASDGERQFEFLYEWVEISPPAAALLFPPPRPGEEYLGQAVLTQEQGAWKVKSFQALDFEKPMARLQEIASGVLK